MGRKKRSLQNIIVALGSEFLVVLVGIFFPGALVLNYGSRVNGLITSLQQMMQYFLLVEGGLAGAAIFALYKPLAEQDTTQICRILSSVKKLYTKVGWTFVLMILGSSLVYPWFIADVGYPKWVVSSLFCLIGTNGATQLLFIGKYKVLLTASQNNRYVVLLNSLSTCLFSGVIILVSFCNVHILAAVALGCSAYALRALGFSVVTRRLFPQYTFQSTQETYILKNQREVFIEQILSLIVMNSGTVVLSFSRTDMAEISVFTVYNMVLLAVLMLTNAVHNGVSAGFGDLISRNDAKKLRNAYMRYEILYWVFWTVIFSCTSALYHPFVVLYTNRFTDAVYNRPVLCLLFSIYGAIWSVRIQQVVLISAAGKFKEIQKHSIIEAILTVVFSIAGLAWGGLEGLMLGRCLAAGYRMLDFTWFSHRHVLGMDLWFSAKGFLASTAVIICINILGSKLLYRFAVDSYLHWGIYACCIAMLAAAGAVMANALVYLKNVTVLFKN